MGKHALVLTQSFIKNASTCAVNFFKMPDGFESFSSKSTSLGKKLNVIFVRLKMKKMPSYPTNHFHSGFCIMFITAIQQLLFLGNRSDGDNVAQSNLSF